jgi:hypothetical protein
MNQLVYKNTPGLLTISIRTQFSNYIKFYRRFTVFINLNYPSERIHGVMVFVVSQLSTQYLGERAKTGWLGIRIMCLGGATCLSEDCCCSEIAL